MLLCFICYNKCNIGFVNKQIKTLADQIASEMSQFTSKLWTEEESNHGGNAAGQGQVGYDPMKDPNKVNVVY